MTKRLFLFAGYDKQGIIDDTLIHYLTALSALGDIVLIMDCEVQDSQKLDQIKNLLHTEFKHHGEYDFGSYKRGYMWAYDKKILGEYDWVYLVNDSVYGPLFDLAPALEKLESAGTDLTGMTSFFDKFVPKHVQSWFVGLSKKIASSPMIYDFMQSVKARSKKIEVICKYEVGLSRTILQHGFEMFVLYEQQDYLCHTVYEDPKTILENFIPFVKKRALRNLEMDTLLLPYTTDAFNDMIFAHAKRTGLEYPEKTAKHNYKKVFRLTIFAIPICTIYRKTQMKETVLNIYIFDKVRVMKIVKHNYPAN